jgi:hypothetical protein
MRHYTYIHLAIGSGGQFEVIAAPFLESDLGKTSVISVVQQEGFWLNRVQKISDDFCAPVGFSQFHNPGGRN